MPLRRVASELPPGFPQGLKVLLVEGSGASAEAQLRQCAYEVTRMPPEEAVAAVTNEAPYDVMLVDANLLKEKTGANLREKVSLIPTIMMAADPNHEEIMMGIKLGVAEVLQKPLCPLKLKNIWQHTVRRMMQKTAGNGKKSRGISVSPRSSQESQHGTPAQSGLHAHLLAPARANSAPILAGIGEAGSPESCEHELIHMQQMAEQSQLYTPSSLAGNANSPRHTDTGNSGTLTSQGSSALGADIIAPTTSEEPRKHLTVKRKSKEGSQRLSTGVDSVTGIIASIEAPPAVPVASPFNLPTEQIAMATPAGLSGPLGMDAMACGMMPPNPAGLGWPNNNMVGTASLPTGMAWGMPMNPLAAAPGITPPIFPAPASVPYQFSPMLPQPNLPAMNPAMFPPMAASPFGMSPAMSMSMPGCNMPGFGGLPPMPGQLPALPLPLLMNACGSHAGMPGMPACLPMGADMSGMSPCSPAPTDPSLTTLSDKSVQDVLALNNSNGSNNVQAPPTAKMARCESNQMLPSLEELIADNPNDAEMLDLDLDGLSLGCLGIPRNDSLEDLITRSIVAF